MKYFQTKRWYLIGLVASSALLAACGSDEKAAPNLAPFLGTWNIGQAVASVTCSSNGTESAIGGMVNIAKGQGADLAMTFTDPSLTGCTMRFNVQGESSAVPLVGEKCVLAIPNVSATLTVASGAFGVLGNEGNLMLAGGAAVVVSTLGLSLTCMGDVTGMLTRGPTADAGTDAL